MAIWLEVGGAASSINDASCQRLAALGARGIHCVVPDMGTYQAQINSIRKYGMVGTLDIEVPLWVNTGFNVNADLSQYLPQLKAQAAAGWSYFAAEGIGRAGVAAIGSVRPYINYGDENGANMYAGQYNHAPNAHFANLLESYHKSAVPAYLQSAAVAKANCKNFGITLMMYNPSDLEQDTTALINYINQVGGVQDVLMWTGVVSDVLSVFNQPWANIVSTLKTTYGYRTDSPWSGVTPPPPPPSTTVTVASSPATCSRDGTTIDYFFLGSDKAIWHRHNKQWDSIEGVGASAPAAIAGFKNPGRIDVFVRGEDAGIYQRTWDGAKWNPLKDWNSLTGVVLAGTDPSVSIVNGMLTVTVIGGGHAVYTKSSADGVTWPMYWTLEAESTIRA